MQLENAPRVVERDQLLQAGFTDAQADLLERVLNELSMRPIDPELTEQARAAYREATGAR